MVHSDDGADDESAHGRTAVTHLVAAFLLAVMTAACSSSSATTTDGGLDAASRPDLATGDAGPDSEPETWIACRVAIDDEYNPCASNPVQQIMNHPGSELGDQRVCSSIFLTFHDSLLGWTCTYNGSNKLIAWERIQPTPRCGGVARAVFADLYAMGQLQQSCLEVDSGSWTWQLGFDPGPPTIMPQLWTSTPGASATLAPGLGLVAGGSEFPASDLTLRYWYTADPKDGVIPEQSVSCESVFLDCGSAKTSLVPVAPPRPTADTYLEVSFPGQNAPVPTGFLVGLAVSIIRADGALYDQSNDYSYNGELEPAPTTKVTAYLKGVLVAGTEP